MRVVIITTVLTMLLLLIGSPVALSRVVTLLEDNTAPLISALAEEGVAKVSTEWWDVYRGWAAIRVDTPASGTRNQVYVKRMPHWNYKVVEHPSRTNEFRYIMFAWKKMGGSGIMLQLANNGTWASNVSLPAPVFRYVAGVNISDPAMAAVNVSNYSPSNWTVVIRDLYADFGEFTLTGIAFTPFNYSCLFDSIYLTQSCTYDVNKDGKVTWIDVYIVCVYYGRTISGTANPNPDVDRNGKVNWVDIDIVCQHFGETGLGGAPNAIIPIIPPQYLPVLIKLHDQVTSQPQPNPTTLSVLERLINSVGKVGITTWGKCKRDRSDR